MHRAVDVNSHAGRIAEHAACPWSPDRIAFGVDDLHAVVRFVRHVDEAVTTDGHVIRVVERTRVAAPRAEREQVVRRVFCGKQGHRVV